MTRKLTTVYLCSRRGTTSFGAILRIRLGEDRTPTMLLILPENGQRRWETGPTRLQGPCHPRAFLCGCVGVPAHPTAHEPPRFSLPQSSQGTRLCARSGEWSHCGWNALTGSSQLWRQSGAVSRLRMCRPLEQKLQSLFGGGNAQVQRDLTVF